MKLDCQQGTCPLFLVSTYLIFENPLVICHSLENNIDQYVTTQKLREHHFSMTFAGKYNGDDDDLEADAEADDADEVDRFGGFAGEDFPSNELRLRDEFFGHSPPL